MIEKSNSEYNDTDNISTISETEETTSNVTTQKTLKSASTSSVNVIVSSVKAMPYQNTSLVATVKYSNGTNVDGVTGVFKINGVTVGTATVNNGVAKLNYTTENWSAKSYNLTFKLSVNSKSYTGSTTFVIYKSNVTVTLSTHNTTPGSTIQLKATVKYANGTSLSSGKVAFKINGVTIDTVSLTNGVATINYTVPSSYGSYTLTAVVGETSSSNSAKGTSTLTLSDKSTISMENLVVVKKGNSIKITVYIEGTTSGVGASDGKISFKINGKTIDTVSVSKGQASVTYDTSSLSYGIYNISIVYGSSKYLTTSTYNDSYLRIVSSTTKFTYSQILKKANDTKAFIEENNRLPNYVTIDGHQVNMVDFLYMLCEVFSGNSSYYIGGFDQGITNNKTTCVGTTISQSDYIDLAQVIVDCYSINGRTPRSITYGNQTISFADTVYFYTSAVAFIYENGRMSNYGTVNSVNSTSSSTSSTSYFQDVPSGYEYLVQSTTNCQVNSSSIIAAVKEATAGVTGTYNIAVAIFNWANDNTDYSSYSNTRYGATSTLSRGYGNCCDLTHLLIAMFRTAGIPARYAHATCTFSSGTTVGHVWAQVYINGKWYDCDISSSKNSFDDINNWYKCGTIKTYTTLPF
ncbi:MAG: hypothetical protein LUG89_00400 [Methanosphaera sp.]|nr:hypothetical protein [Methanosphaera sp.]